MRLPSPSKPSSRVSSVEDDIPKIPEYCCAECLNCPTGEQSSQEKARSLQEEFEQEVIKRSVRVDIKNRRVWVNLTFTKEPEEFLVKKHGKIPTRPNASMSPSAGSLKW
jgi:hypothetical protein